MGLRRGAIRYSSDVRFVTASLISLRSGTRSQMLQSLIL